MTSSKGGEHLRSTSAWNTCTLDNNHMQADQTDAGQNAENKTEKRWLETSPQTHRRVHIQNRNM